jgi:hypothetical protein
VTILDTILFGMLAGVITMKVALLATAAVLFVSGLPEQFRQRKVPPAAVAVKHPGLDVHT